ncbi:MAG: ProQ/FINO family protein [Albidovulum sp.]
MTDPNPAAVDPVAAGPGPTAAPDPAPALPVLAEAYPACFDWERPRPLKLNIHRDLMAAGHDRIAVKRALGRYCKADRYRRALQTDAPRIDLQGRPAGAVTEREAAHARSLVEARATARESPPPDATPIPEENLVSGRLELTAKFSELPRPLPVRGGIKIGIETGEGTVTAILPAKVWRKLEQAAKDYPQWVAALSGALERFADGEIALKHPALQIFERKARPETAAEAKAPEPDTPPAEAPDEKASDPKAPEPKTRDAPAPAPVYPKLSLKARGAAKAG